MIKTLAGDTWDLVAFREMGSCKYTPQLMKVNKDKLQYFVFPADVELTIPEIEESGRTALTWYSA